MQVDGSEILVKAMVADSGCTTSTISSNHPLITNLRRNHPDKIFAVKRNVIQGFNDSKAPIATAVDLLVSIPEIPAVGMFPFRLHIAEAMNTPLILLGIEEMYENYIGASLFPRPPRGDRPELDAHFDTIDKVHAHLLEATTDNPAHRRLVHSVIPYTRSIPAITVSTSTKSIMPVLEDPSALPPVPSALVATAQEQEPDTDFLPTSMFYTAPSSAHSTEPNAQPFGLGLFTKTHMKPGQRIRPFTSRGQWINEEEWRRRCMRGEGQYILANHRSSTKFYDCFHALDDCLMSRVNSCTRAQFHTGRLNGKPVMSNCRLEYKDGVFLLVATRYIQPNDELFFSYGIAYQYPGPTDSHYSDRTGPVPQQLVS